MKTMIWTTAFGDDIYTEMAREMVKSLRATGYDGDVFVISDKPSDVSGATVFPGSGMAKAAIRHHVNLSEYDYAAFIDADFLFSKNPEEFFFHDVLIHSESKVLTKRNSLFLNDEQRAQEYPSVNSGFVSLKGSVAQDFLSGWEKAWESCPIDETRKSADCYKDSTLDQPALQKFVMDNGINWVPFHEIGLPFISGDQSKPIIHLCGPLNNGKNTSLQNKRVVLGEMKKHNGEYSENTLLYTICFGNEIHFRMGEEMIWSARREGYKGQIVVLCDRDWYFPGGAKTIKMKRDSGQLFKTRIREVENLCSYRHVVYCDTDVIWVQNPDKMMKGDLPRVAGGPTLLASAPATNAFMTSEEKLDAAKNKTHGINTGTVCFPGVIGDWFLKTWENKWSEFDKSPLSDVWNGKAPDYQLYDEAALWVMLLRGEIMAEIMPSNEVFFPVMHAIPHLRTHFGYESPDYDHRCLCAHFVATSLKMNHDKVLDAMRVTLPENVPLVVKKFEEEVAALQNAVRGNGDITALKKEVEKLTLAVVEMGRVLKWALEAKHEKVDNL